MTDARPPLLPGPGTVNILRWLGYGLIAFAAVDLLAVLYPPDFTNPQWEIQFIGNLVERAPVPLLGFALVFLSNGLKQGRKPALERLSLKVVSYGCLVLAFVFLALVPLGISNTVRLNTQNGEALDTQLQQATTQLDRRLEVWEQQIAQADSSNIQEAVRRLQTAAAAAEQGNQSQSLTPQAANLLELMQGLPFQDRPEVAKQGLLERLREQNTRQKAQIGRRASRERTRLRKNLLENSLKWNFGALLTSALFLMMYLQSEDIRKLSLTIGKKAPRSGGLQGDRPST